MASLAGSSMTTTTLLPIMAAKQSSVKLLVLSEIMLKTLKRLHQKFLACPVFHVSRENNIGGARIAKNVAKERGSLLGWIGMSVVSYVALTSP